MATTMKIKELLDTLLGMDGVFILRNGIGSMELHGEDFYLSAYQEWLTVYHETTPRSPESRSHLHLRWQTLKSAEIREEAGHTSHLAFFDTPEPAVPGGDESPLVWYFPSFYNWSNNKAEIPENLALYNAFIEQYGTTLQFVEPSPDDS